MISFFRWNILAALLLPFSCSQEQEKGTEIARVNDQQLMLEAVRQRIDTAGGISEQQVRSFTAQWINSELLYQEAKKMGLDESPKILRTLEDAKRQLVVNALLEQEVFTDSLAGISGDDIRSYYNGHLNEFIFSDDVVWISLAVFTARDEAAAFRSAVIDNRDWKSAIQKAKSSGGFLTNADSMIYSRASLFPAELWKVTTALKADEVSFPVKTGRGFFVIQLLGGYGEKSTKALRFVEDEIRHRLLLEKKRQRYADYLESLRQRSAISVNLSGMQSGVDTLLRIRE